MEKISSNQLGMIVGALIGAILGAGAAYLLMTAPAGDRKDDKPVSAKDLLALTGAGAAFVRKLDDVRRKT